MKRTNCLLTGVCAAALAALSAGAQTQPTPSPYVTTTRIYVWPGYTGAPPGQAGDVYLNFDLGGVLTQDLIVRSAGGQKVPFDPGIGGNISVGFDVTDALCLELQTGATSSSLNTSANTVPAFGGFDVNLYQVPMLANVIFKAPIHGGLTPYVGAGAGGVFSELEMHQHGFYQSDTDATFGYQALAGIRCTLNRFTELGVGYRFLGTTAHTWFQNNPAAYTSTGPTFSHSILATLTLSF
jgi:opacity protein-like surface antigen